PPAPYVAIENRMTLTAAQRENRAGRRAADSRQRDDVGKRERKLAPVLLADALRRAVQVSRTRVVAETRPQVQHFIERARGERAYVGKALHEALVKRNYRGNLGLLQHDLRHPHAVRCGAQ